MSPPHMPLTAQRGSCALWLCQPRLVCCQKKKKTKEKEYKNKAKRLKISKREKEYKKLAVHFALLFNFAAQRLDKLLSKMEGG